MLANESLFEYITWCFTLISLTGAYLNVQRNRWGFFLWIIANGFWMSWNFAIGQYALSFQFLAFLGLAVQGFLSWKEETAIKQDRYT